MHWERMGYFMINLTIKEGKENSAESEKEKVRPFFCEHAMALQL